MKIESELTLEHVIDNLKKIKIIGDGRKQFSDDAVSS